MTLNLYYDLTKDFRDRILVGSHVGFYQVSTRIVTLILGRILLTSS